MSPYHRALVAGAYHDAATEFSRAADRHVYQPLAGPLVRAAVELAGSHPRPVLDVAAGTGAFGRAFPDVVAVDIAAGQLAANPAAHRVRGNAEHLPFRRGAFAVAGCAFGINHLLDPCGAVREMARVAPVVALSTWARPEAGYAPKRIVNELLERRLGRSRSAVGETLDRLGDRVGSVGAVRGLLDAAGIEARVAEVEVAVPWPGIDAYLEYRLSMPTTQRTAGACDVAALREELVETIGALPPDALTWRPSIVIGVGTR